jgi:hypothetical protein
MGVKAWLALCISGVLALCTTPIAAIGGTTGGVTGRVVDITTQASIPDVTVTITAPSQTATTVTDANGIYRFLSLAPDTYTLSFTKDQYVPLSRPGVTVYADQVQAVSIALTPALKTIANVRSRTTLVKPGTTSDVYSMNAGATQAAAALIGPGGLNNAYGAVASVPGVALDAGEQGWWQTVHIRGGDIDQVGYELDGIPVNRVYDNAPMTMLSSLGQQELQVYTGGTPASADAQGISGYVNQVVKTGTYPGFGTMDLGVGTPAFYHKASVEAGGSNPDRTFSWYVGLGGANQDYRYIDNNDGASQFNSFFYPVNLVDPNSFAPSSTNGFVYIGENTSPGVNNSTGAGLFGPGIMFGLINTQQRDSIANLHFAIPHKHSVLRDDVQLLYLASEVSASYFSSQSDISSALANQLGQNVWDDSAIYNGPLMQPPNPAAVTPYFFPHSPTNRPLFAPLPAAERDQNDNGVGVYKLQYQHTFSPTAFVRAYGYMLYSNWYIYGPNTAAQPFYGAELAQYEIPDHTFGGNLSFTGQLSSRNLLTASAAYTGSNLDRYDIGFIRSNYNVASFVGADGNCYDPNTPSTQVSCYAQAYNGITNCPNATVTSDCGSIQNVASGTLPLPAPGALNPQNARWIATNNYFYSGSGSALNQVHTRFSGFSVSDQWRPNDALIVNAGLRLEDFKYLFGDTLGNDPARQFWFTHYNEEYCATPGSAPFLNPSIVAAGGAISGPLSCPAGSSSPNLTNPANPPSYSVWRTQPRIGFTYTLNADTVIRGSFGVYARPPNSSWVQYNVVQRDLPTYMGNHFFAYGFTTPEHFIRPDTSYNTDISLEHHLKGTDWSFKLTPFYRSTKDQLQNFFIDPLGGLESGLNVGTQRSVGIEVAVQKGDFARNGLSGQASYTYTHSQIKYHNFFGQNINIVDQLNGYISQYNGFTQAGGGSPCYTFGSAASGAGTPASCSAPNVVANPYYNQSPQPLLDRNAYYPTYDVVPGPVAGTNGYWVPHIASLILNYRADKFAITPTLTYSSGAEYGAPTVWPGYDPRSCSATLPGASNPLAADPAKCDDLGNLPLFIPDPFSGKYDTLGQFKEPWRLSMSLGLSYDISQKMTARVSLVNIVDTCGQRGYAWDNPNVCVYGALPSGFMYPAGNFYPNSLQATPPPQMRFPYSFWLNNANTGFVGVRVPMQVTFDLEFKL